MKLIKKEFLPVFIALCVYASSIPVVIASFCFACGDPMRNYLKWTHQALQLIGFLCLFIQTQKNLKHLNITEKAVKSLTHGD